MLVSSTMKFFNRLEDIVRAKTVVSASGSIRGSIRARADSAAGIIAENRRIIEATAPYAAAYKPNMAFYEALGPRPAWKPSKRTISIIPDGIPVILDAKRCDIDATAEAYATGAVRAPGRRRRDPESRIWVATRSIPSLNMMARAYSSWRERATERRAVPGPHRLRRRQSPSLSAWRANAPPGRTRSAS